MEVVIIKWRDASLHGQGTKFEEDIEDLGLITLITAGVVVKEDDEAITLCMDFSPEQISYRSCGTYPKSCFKIIKRVKIPKEYEPVSPTPNGEGE